jgi:hypothetical protein
MTHTGQLERVGQLGAAQGCIQWYCNRSKPLASHETHNELEPVAHHQRHSVTASDARSAQVACESGSAIAARRKADGPTTNAHKGTISKAGRLLIQQLRDGDGSAGHRIGAGLIKFSTSLNEQHGRGSR